MLKNYRCISWLFIGVLIAQGWCPMKSFGKDFFRQNPIKARIKPERHLVAYRVWSKTIVWLGIRAIGSILSN